ncbi:tetratricopeptide repeat protein [Hyalangium versicolor]|uniref:tetratricopeptide repeat protein n=1 Tax=Hyalangium versicolor TaxID=2861190 RepID=UPI001CC92141|nr:tetratricopeptide repeat protein [Hyalangium versicolor]
MLAASPEADSQLGFAHALRAEGDYYRAISEYKRFLYLYPDSPAADEARLGIGRAYVLGGQADFAEEYLHSLEALSPEWRTRARLEIGWARYTGGHPERAILSLRAFLREQGSQQGADVDRARYLLGWALLSEGDGEQAAQAFASITPFPAQGRLTEAARSWGALPRKSPALAGVLSIIPGAGHVYIGEPVVGLAALAWNGLFSYALYESIRGGQVGFTVLLGALELLWYSGTIFGAVNGAQKYNRDARQEALDGLKARYDDHPEAWPPPSVPSP